MALNWGPGLSDTEIYRQLTKAGYDCVVTVPSLIPKKAGERVKTDRRDAVGLARLFRAGKLTSIWVPDKEQEAMRDLTRAREDMKEMERRSRQRLGGFLLRHGKVYPGKSKWTKAYFRWLETPAIRMTLDTRQRQLLDEDKSCGTQPAYIRMIYRRLSSCALTRVHGFNTERN